MPPIQPTYHSRIFRDFKEIEESNHRRIIHFYEGQEGQIRGLDFEEYFELLMAYVNGLFEVGYHQKHLLMVEVAIGEVIAQNVRLYKGEDVLERLLFRKAASHYRCLQYDACDHTLKELVRINPFHTDAAAFLKKCLRRKEPRFVQHAKALSIAAFLVAALVIAFEVLLVRPFYEVYAKDVELSRNGVFALGCLSLIGGLLIHRWRVSQKVEAFVRRARAAKGA
ncbi:hypothetical protein [Phaeodactylibacter luteus]|uniref:Uncharacterized protein n=1 Tax=Phaeodactylibacter luteus TaxID=1564516 RepID=A0A5C6S1X3_9BACT|nr:hypothetical protein [Phaeodactylibacter luteus]TXB67969.1 hypothetical protein FRY97_03740 [Phaeodactylibacter luteus]